MRFAVLGDLHLDPDDPRFERARAQLREAGIEHAVCLGDLGCRQASGTRGAFEAARSWLEGLGVPFTVLLGNHDLERTDVFASDREAVACFCEVMSYEKPYRAFELGPALGITLSSTAFRDNRGFRHEVSIDDEQFRWFAETLEREPERPTFVFSHAPPLGSQLRVLQVPHLRSGNAWLNQSNGPRRFHELLARHPQVRLWFSAHSHLGHDHPRALSHVGRCLFVHTGLIGSQTRDDRHQSRLVAFDGDRISIETIEHERGAKRRDARFPMDANQVERFEVDPARVNAPCLDAASWDEASCRTSGIRASRSQLIWSQGMWVEFDRELADPVGVLRDGDTGAEPFLDERDIVMGTTWRRTRTAPSADGYYFASASSDRSAFDRLRLRLRAIARRLLGRKHRAGADRPRTSADPR